MLLAIKLKISGSSLLRVHAKVKSRVRHMGNMYCEKFHFGNIDIHETIISLIIFFSIKTVVISYC